MAYRHIPWKYERNCARGYGHWSQPGGVPPRSLSRQSLQFSTKARGMALSRSRPNGFSRGSAFRVPRAYSRFLTSRTEVSEPAASRARDWLASAATTCGDQLTEQRGRKRHHTNVHSLEPDESVLASEIQIALIASATSHGRVISLAARGPVVRLGHEKAWWAKRGRWSFVLPWQRCGS